MLASSYRQDHNMAANACFSALMYVRDESIAEDDNVTNRNT
jgi:hypothetical protein